MKNFSILVVSKSPITDILAIQYMPEFPPPELLNGALR